MSDPLDRSGHLSGWAFDRLALDAPASDPGFFEAAQAHLDACRLCQKVLAAREAEAPGLTLSPPISSATGADVIPIGAKRRPRAWIAGVAALAVAASVLFLTRPTAPDLTPKGTRFDFEVHVHDGTRTTRVADGARIRPGDRVGFKARAAEPGWVLVFGWDDRGSAYPAYPVSADGTPGAAVALAPSGAVEPLPAALELDAHGDVEHLAAVFCGERFTFADLGAGTPLNEAALGDNIRARGCVLHAIALRKAR